MTFKTFTVGEVLTAGDVNNYLMKQAVIGCTSGTRPSGPGAGMTIYETDTKRIKAYDSGPGWETYATVIRPTVGDSQSDEYTFTATSYGVTTTSGTYVTCGVAFVAPDSGAVTIHWAARLVNSTTGATEVSPAVRTGSTVGSGAVASAATSSGSLQVTGTSALGMGTSLLVPGLTSGATYNVRLEHKVDAGTGTARWRRVVVTPAT